MADSSSSTEGLTQDIQKLLSEQREDVVGTYPADFLYHSMKGEDGNPLIVKVDDTYYSAWMSRDEAGAPFSKVTLLTENQVNEIYAQIPGGPSGKMNTGESVYVNPDLDNREVAADSVTNVIFNVETGEIVSAAQVAQETAISSRSARRSRSTEPENNAAAKYDTATVPNNVIADGNVSADDLKQQLEGYQLISHIDSEAAEESNKRSTTGILINDVGASISRLLVTQGGAVAPSIEIDNASVLSSTSNLSLETRLIAPQDAAPAAPATAPAPVDLGYGSKMQGIINSGSGQADPNSAFRANEIPMLTRGFDDIAGNLAKGTLTGDSAAMDNVDSLIILFPEHRDIIASYALAEEQNAGTDPKTYLDQVQQRNPAAPVATPPAAVPVSSGAEASSKLQSLLDVVGGDVENGERISQVNRDVGQVHRYLDSISGDKNLFKSEASSAIDYLNAQGLTKHAALLSGYADDPSTYRDVRTALREVAALSAPTLSPADQDANRAWEAAANEEEPDVSVTPEQFASELRAKLDALGLPSDKIPSELRDGLIKAQSEINEGRGSSPLDTLLNQIDRDLQSNASMSQINRDVGQVLRYLNNFAVSPEVLQQQAAQAVDFLNDKGLTKHAEIISDYAKDPATFKDARSSIREVVAVNVNSAAFGDIASNADSVDAQIEEFKAELAGVDGMDLAIDDASPDVSLTGMKA
ncbi:MAG: hypothetical protein COB36_01335 [Alphaproteobacteria bacterium]|nr:MAG: hypothetical protein COB36_01335 [Alphaproteobacteria bacterium]